MTPKLVVLLPKVCSVFGNICKVSWHLSKLGSELKKGEHLKVPFGIYVVHKNKALFTRYENFKLRADTGSKFGNGKSYTT